MSTAPAFLEHLTRSRWKVEPLGRARNGLQRVRWLEGPLRGGEALLSSKSLRHEP